ncbi:MAG: rhodanese-like domain-containing protein [Granulosicoccus sp.]
MSVLGLTPLLLGLVLFSTQLQAVEEPEGYRTELYDDVVPDSLQGATRVSAIDVKKLMQEIDALVVDVIPEHRRPDFLPEGQLWIPVPHKGLPGALWLPDVGFGVLSEVTEKYFTTHLQSATDGNLNHPMVFYCRQDCWMSWNAAKRALTYGYTQVYWFADGVDDWAFEDYEFENLIAAPGTRQETELIK